MPDYLDRLKTALADRYAIEREIGSGGMATVYLAEDVKHHRKVAVKVLRPDLAAALGPERFLREIEIAANLTHPHIVPLYDSGEAEGFLYYVLPYIEGESLRAKLTREGELPVGDAVRIVRDVVDALTEAHAHGVVHRDIKPDNVLLTRHHALVTDFGVAKAVSEATGREKLTTAGVALGTPAYMAPEQAVADPHIDHRADIYAVGAVAYELLTGRPPFTGTTPQMVLSAHVTESPEPVTKYRETVPPALAQLVMKCLEKKPADRWQSAEELLPQLEALATPSGGVTPTDTRPVGAVQAVRSKTLVRAGALLGTLVVTAVGWWLFAGRDGTTADHRSGRIPIAVLVFENRSATEDDEFFSEGIADDINTQLSKIGGFAVKAHASARRLSREEMSYSEIADQLGADYLVHGNWRRAGDSVRITARLILPETQEQLWAENYNRELTASNMFDVRSDVAEQVAAALNVAVAPNELAQLAAEPTDNLEAYNAYLLGRFFWSKRTGQDLQQAIEYFQQAIATDPAFALAYAALAESYALLDTYNVLPPRDASPRAEEAALKALERDSTLAEAHAVLASTAWTYHWDWTAAEREYMRAIELNPDYPTAHHWYAWYLMSMGRFDQAVVEMRRAQEVDPLSLIIRAEVGVPFYYAKNYKRAIEEYQKALEMDPNFPVALTLLALAYVEEGMFEEGITQARKALTLSPGHADALAALGYAYGVSGRRREALKVLNELIERAMQGYVQAILLASVYAGLGETDSAFEWLEKAYEERGYGMTLIRSDPQLDRLRSDPRFQGFVRRMNFPE